MKFGKKNLENHSNSRKILEYIGWDVIMWDVFTFFLEYDKW